VLIEASGRPRVCDFGLARIFLDDEDTGMTTTSEHTGTERYLAPELVMSETTVYPTIQSDVYALGCLGLEVSCALHHVDLLKGNLNTLSSYIARSPIPIAKII
jgi:serine/threonine protein kinase